MAIIKNAEPFFFPGSTHRQHGILLIHGFTGAPGEIKPLGEALNKAGYTVLGIRLPGHGKTPLEMKDCNRKLWYGAVEDGYHLLRGICEQVSVAGLSMGGLLALKLAAEYPVHKVMTLAAAVFTARTLFPTDNEFLYGDGNYRPLHPYHVHYLRTPGNCIQELLALAEEVRCEIPHITAPLLVASGGKDEAVKPESADFIINNAASSAKQALVFADSGHMLTFDCECQSVFAAAADFFRK